MNKETTLHRYITNRYHIIILLTITMLVGCKEDRHDYIKCDKIKVIGNFPKEVTLPQSRPLPIDLTGCLDVFAMDSLMVCKIDDDSYFWEVVSLKTLRSYGKFMPKGHGKNEYEQMPCSEVIYKDGDSLYCNYYVNNSRTLYKSNLTASIVAGSLVSKPQKEFHQHGDLSKVIYLSDSTYFAVKYNLNIGFERAIINKNDSESPINIGNLNNITINNEINTLSACREVNKNKMMVVEAMLRFNQTNLYSLRDSFNITLSMSPNLASSTATDNLSKNQRRKYFGTIFTTDTYFATLYYDMLLRDYYEDPSGKSQILLFDWQGNPIMKIKIPYIATSFFITTDYLYVFTNITEKEQLYRYKLKIS